MKSSSSSFKLTSSDLLEKIICVKFLYSEVTLRIETHYVHRQECSTAGLDAQSDLRESFLSRETEIRSMGRHSGRFIGLLPMPSWRSTDSQAEGLLVGHRKEDARNDAS